MSYTNEGQLVQAYDALRQWLKLGGEVVPVLIHATNDQEAQRLLVEGLLDVARRSPEEIEADVQVALGVLFNASEVGSSRQLKRAC